MVHQDAHGLVKLAILMAMLNQIGYIILVNYPICYAYYVIYLPMSYLPIYIYVLPTNMPSIYLFTCLFIYLSINLSTYIPMNLPIIHISTYIHLN
jgi:hypothetical protein